MRALEACSGELAVVSAVQTLLAGNIGHALGPLLSFFLHSTNSNTIMHMQHMGYISVYPRLAGDRATITAATA